MKGEVREGEIWDFFGGEINDDDGRGSSIRVHEYYPVSHR